MQEIDEHSFAQLCALTWSEIAPPPAPPHRPSEEVLTDALRRACAELATTHERASDPVIAAFRAEMVKLVVADDQHLLTRSVSLAAALPPLPVEGGGQPARRHAPSTPSVNDRAHSDPPAFFL